MTLHDGQEYLLPVIARHQQIVPRFNADGTVSVETVAKDAELAPLLDAFLELVATYDRGEKSIVFATAEIYADFFRLVARLLTTNYDYSPEELTTLLTVNNEQLRVLFESIFKHVLQQ